VILAAACAASCSDDPAAPAERCKIVSLPLRGSSVNAPTVIDVGLEIQTSGIVIEATATDPQGDANLTDILQSVGVFPDVRCEGEPIVLRDDLVGSGVEETFGTAISAASNRALYDAIAGANRWPVVVDFEDRDGNRTTGRVNARIER
jgi:hypothetical protein